MTLLYYFLFLLSLLYFPFLFFFNGVQNTHSTWTERTVWYQDFQENPRFNLDQTIEKYPQFERNFFKSDRLIAYFNERGEILHKVYIDNQSLVSVQNNGYLIYKKVGELVDFYDNTGVKKWSYSTLTYPHLSPLRNNILFITSDNSFISLIDRNQKQLLNKTYLGTLISDLSFCLYNDDFAVGTVDGNFYKYSHKGEILFTKELTSSTYNYVKSIQCSYSGEYLAVLSGLQPETISLYNSRGTLLWEKETGVERRKKTSLLVDEENGFLIDERNGELHLLNLENGEEQSKISLNNEEPIKYTLFSNAKDYLLVGYNEDGVTQNLVLYDVNGKMIWQKEYDDPYLRHIDLKRDGNSLNLLVVLNAKIVVYQLKKMS